MRDADIALTTPRSLSVNGGNVLDEKPNPPDPRRSICGDMRMRPSTVAAVMKPHTSRAGSSPSSSTMKSAWASLHALVQQEAD